MKDKAKRLNSVKQAEQICCYGTIFDRCASIRIVDYGFPSTDRLKWFLAIFWAWIESMHVTLASVWKIQMETYLREQRIHNYQTDMQGSHLYTMYNSTVAVVRNVKQAVYM